ncbi:hypothetical protein Nmel_002946 [Mimus melanotis]
MWASAHTGEKGRDGITHWRMAFAILGIPFAVKTDNGRAYVSQKTRQFLQMWEVSHSHGTPHCPTSQVIGKRAHGTLKRVLEKQKRGMAGETPHSRLEKALYAIHYQPSYCAKRFRKSCYCESLLIVTGFRSDTDASSKGLYTGFSHE